MVNYVLSFCKITGASKIFARNFYLPLLKPLTPKDALRTLRITGKWLLGAKYQHYIPVLRDHRRKTDEPERRHDVTDDFTYMTPGGLDPDSEGQRRLRDLLDSKPKSPGLYVYTVGDKKCNIVVEAAFELAVRDGDIIDVLLSQKTDKILVKTRDFKKVPVEIRPFEPAEGRTLYGGRGATTAEEERHHHHGKYTMGLAKLFEERETREDKWEEELRKIVRGRRKHKWEGTRAFKETMRQIMRKFDWRQFEEDAKRVIEDIEAPPTETPIAMEIEDLAATRGVNETIGGSGELLGQLPTLEDIPDVVRNLGRAKLADLAGALSGAQVTLASGKECFVSGQMVHTEDGDVFVPGQTVRSEFGEEYAPGITVNIDNKPTLVNGLIMGDERKDPLFLPAQSTITSGGRLTFATAPEERPAPEPEEERQIRRKKLLRIVSVVTEEEDDEVIVEDLSDDSSASSDLDGDDDSDSDSEEELNHDSHRKKPDDGMNDLINSLEQKKLLLKLKLDELRKLSVAPESSSISYVDDSDAMEAATKITAASTDQLALSEVFIAIARRAARFGNRRDVRPENIDLDVNVRPTEWDERFNGSSRKLKVLFKTALVAASEVYGTRPKDQALALHSAVDIMEDPLRSDPGLLAELLGLLDTSASRLELCDAVLKQLTVDISHTKAARLKNLTQANLGLADCLKYLDEILEDGVMKASFGKLLKLCPETVLDLSSDVRTRSIGVAGEEAALETLQDSIVATSKRLMDKNFQKLLGNSESVVLEFIEEALSFAKVLDLEGVTGSLSRQIDGLEDDRTVEMLKRMTLIRQLAEKDYSLRTAMARIKKNPERAGSDPRIRQLIRESAILVSETSRPVVFTSRNIPLDLMKKQNLLSIEDFLMRNTRLDVPAVMVSRGTHQAVIPRESARGVLAGRVPYVLIDESGVANFRPRHMLSTMSVMNKDRERRIGEYLSGGRERSKSIDVMNNNREGSRTYLQAESNSPDGRYAGAARGRAMSSGALLGHRRV